MFTGNTRMAGTRWICAIVWFYFLLVTLVTCLQNMDTQAPLKCLNIGKTKFKLCINNDKLAAHTDLLNQSQMGKKPTHSMYTSHTTSGSSPLYNGRILTDYGGMVEPFFMKRQSHRVVPIRSIYRYKLAEGMEDSRVKKRPFDSISYNTGLGGFR